MGCEGAGEDRGDVTPKIFPRLFHSVTRENHAFFGYLRFVIRKIRSVRK
nr:MAG TPA_asm: hypothetical protein [Caudoviricetes sp.]